ncbi:MAG: DUF4236 domain-containing protein [Gemmatimonadetes bacterium]|nr:DUF4236 domain-containing protein [Gemmatimonadota bacterium]
MGFVFRRSIRLGPLRWNLSRAGLGTSVGFPGFRFGTNAQGQKYLWVGVPGTGVGYHHTFRSRASGITPSQAPQVPKAPSTTLLSGQSGVSTPWWKGRANPPSP